MIYDKIRAALENHLNTSSFTLPDIAWENTGYSPTTGEEFLKVQILPTSRRPTTQGNNRKSRVQGIMNIMCHFPEDTGSGATSSLVNDLVSRFDSTTDISYDGIVLSLEYVEAQSSYIKSPWYVTPVTVAWYIYES